MEHNNKRGIFFNGIFIVLNEIIFLILSIFMMGYLDKINSKYEWRLSGEWVGLYYLLVIFIIVFLIILFAILIIVYFSGKNKNSTSKVITAWVIIGLSIIFSIFPIIINTREIRSKLIAINSRSKTPFYNFCLGCNLNGNFSQVESSRPLLEYKNLRSFYKDTFIVEQKHSFREKLWGIKDISGTIILNAMYNEIGQFNEDIALTMIKKNGKANYGYIDTIGKLIFPNILAYACEFSHGGAIVVQNNKFGVINNKGKYIIQPIYDCMKDFRNGVAIFYQGKIDGYDRDCFSFGKFGAVNIYGDTIIKPSNYYLFFLADNVIAVYSKNFGSDLRLYNFKGEMIRNEHERYCSNFKYGIACTQYSIIDTCGHDILKTRTDLKEDFKIYVMNRIIQNYEIIKNDNSLSSYEFLEKPLKRKEKYDFNFNLILHYDKNFHATDKFRIYNKYFQSMKLLPVHISNEPYDSAQIEVKNEKFDMTFMYYMKNDSIKSYNIKYK